MIESETKYADPLSLYPPQTAYTPPALFFDCICLQAVLSAALKAPAAFWAVVSEQTVRAQDLWLFAFPVF